MVLGDIEIFIISWVIWVISLVVFGIQELLIIREVRRMGDQDDSSSDEAKPPSLILLVVFILLNIIGMIVDLMNRLPISEYNDETALFRVLRPSFGVLAVSLTTGFVCMYLRRQIPSVIEGDMDSSQSD